MDAQYVADRTQLRHLLAEHPTWKNVQFAQATSRSLAWVKKWRKRLRETDPDDGSGVWGLSRAPHRHRAPIAPKIVEAILDIRAHPPNDLRLPPRATNILYF